MIRSWPFLLVLVLSLAVTTTASARHAKLQPGVLEAPTRIVGVVQGAGGATIPGARVLATGLPPLRLEAKADEKGAFTLDVPTPGTYRLLAVPTDPLHQGLVGLSAVDVHVSAGGEASCILEMIPGATITGSVRRADGQPVVSHGMVTARVTSLGGGAPGRIESTPLLAPLFRGSEFTIRNAHPDWHYELECVLYDIGCVWAEDVRPGEPVELIIAASELRVQVRNAEGPVDGAGLRLFVLRPAEHGPMAGMLSAIPGGFYGTRTLPDGLQVTGLPVDEPLVLRLMRSFCEITEIGPLTLTADASEVGADLGSCANVTVQVLDEQGRPQVGAAVRSWSNLGIGTVVPLARSVTTDDAGVAVLADLPEGDYRCQAAADALVSNITAFSTTSPPTVVECVVLRDASLGTLTVTVVDPDGTPLSEARVVLTSAGPSDGELESLTDSNGQLRFEDVLEGPWKIQLAAKAHFARPVTVDVVHDKAAEVQIQARSSM